jgi:hypothetical protein
MSGGLAILVGKGGRLEAGLGDPIIAELPSMGIGGGGRLEGIIGWLEGGVLGLAYTGGTRENSCCIISRSPRRLQAYGVLGWEL